MIVKNINVAVMSIWYPLVAVFVVVVLPVVTVVVVAVVTVTVTTCHKLAFPLLSRLLVVVVTVAVTVTTCHKLVFPLLSRLLVMVAVVAVTVTCYCSIHHSRLPETVHTLFFSIFGLIALDKLKINTTGTNGSKLPLSTPSLTATTATAAATTTTAHSIYKNNDDIKSHN